MKLFKAESDARAYLEERVPPKEADKTVDTAPLNEQLFETPEAPTPGHYAFEGKNGLKISFDLIAADHAFNRCWQIYKDIEGVQGEYRPIFTIHNLQINSDDFSYDGSDPERRISTTWLPNLQSVASELSHAYSFVDRGEIYLIGQDGFFARPENLLTFFHELGHIKTRSLNDLNQEYASVKTTISAAGVKTEPLKKSALELQRERDANAWMLQKTRGLFDDLEIPRDLIVDYIHHAQLQSYHEVNRKRLEITKEDAE